MTDQYLGKMLGIACEMAGAQGATLFVVEGDVLRPYLVYNIPADYIRGIGPVSIGTQCCGRAIEHCKPWIVSDMLTDPLFADGRAGALASPIRAGFSVPVMLDDRAIASLACHFDHPHTPSDLDIERNQVFANLFSISLRARMRAPFGPPIFIQGSGNRRPVAAA